MESAFWLAGSCTSAADLRRERSMCSKRLQALVATSVFLLRKKSNIPQKRYRFFLSKSVFCTLDIPIKISKWLVLCTQDVTISRCGLALTSTSKSQHRGIETWWRSSLIGGGRRSLSLALRHSFVGGVFENSYHRTPPNWLDSCAVSPFDGSLPEIWRLPV